MKARIYTGGQPCHGCGRFGSDVIRYGKDELCLDCKSDLKLAKSIRPLLDKDNYTQTTLTWYTVGFYKEKADRWKLDKCIREVLSAIEVHTDPKGCLDITQPEATVARDYYIVPLRVAEAMKELVQVINRQQKDFSEAKDAFEVEKKQTLQKERTQIYQQGIERGKQLLMSLNQGTISLKDFDTFKEEYVK